MEFGRVDRPDEVDFTLRPDPAWNRTVLTGAPSPEFRFFFGTSQWIDPAYPGTLYPADMKKGEELIWYARQFNTIEFNPSFYAIPQAAQVERWRQRVPPGFLFCCKVPRAVSHATEPVRSLPLFERFVETIKGFGPSTGPVFLQLPPHIERSRFSRLLPFIRMASSMHPFFIEFRHESWYSAEGLDAAVLEELSSAGCGLVLSDVSGRRDAAHMTLTVPRLMVRWVGNCGHETDARRLADWAGRLADWRSAGLTEACFFLHQPDPGLVPASARRFTGFLQQKGLPVQPLRDFSMQASLF